MLAQDAMVKNEISYAYAAREDGSIRQLVIQDGEGNVIDIGYFGQNTTKEDATAMIGKKYHWASSFTDDELSKHYAMSPEAIAATRAEEIVSNDTRRYTHKIYEE